MENPGYHISHINKGILGEISKIQEELDELKDAHEQNSKVMIGVELSDLYGAIEKYAGIKGFTMEELRKFSDITKRAFNSGRRV